ncbi:MAG TPA: Hsp70 family protein, partial [Phenylobacterium sp.]|nr:Hsp70 family protein [Phenylobacterium sp.]
MTGLSLGIDFGTTNTVVALAGPEGPARLAMFPAPEREVFAFRSALSFHAPPERPSERTVEAGPWAIEAYVEDPLET